MRASLLHVFPPEYVYHWCKRIRISLATVWQYISIESYIYYNQFSLSRNKALLWSICFLFQYKLRYIYVLTWKALSKSESLLKDITILLSALSLDHLYSGGIDHIRYIYVKERSVRIYDLNIYQFYTNLA